MSHDSLGDRMKAYEATFSQVLVPRMPIIIRLDGRAWHTLTKSCERPFDENLIQALNKTGIELCQDISGAQIAFIQSDEITILIHPYKKYASQAWFDGQIQKIVSVSASIASSVMTMESEKVFGKPTLVQFDSRVFVLPEHEVVNNFIFRQNDCARNSVQIMARSMFSHAQCENKNREQLNELIISGGKNWNDIPTRYKRGRCVIKLNGQWIVDNEIPIFSQDREYINKYLATEE